MRAEGAAECALEEDGLEDEIRTGGEGVRARPRCGVGPLGRPEAEPVGSAKRFGGCPDEDCCPRDRRLAHPPSGAEREGRRERPRDHEKTVTGVAREEPEPESC